MSEDFHWRQYLLFCYRNGLYYGELPNDKAVFMWTAKKNLVHCLPENFASEHNADAITKHVLVGSLERLLRQVD
jgi:hypothetical protein